MVIEGQCYCGNVHYRAEGEPSMRAQCHCRECQFFTGGGPNFVLIMPKDEFHYTSGEVASFTRSDLERPVTREFCPNCGTQLASRVASLPSVILKAGTMDNPDDFGTPQAAIYTCDAQSFHTIAEGVPQFEKMPG
ncbi:MAG: GFA family protein [Sphingomonadaceae bacterium]|nr:GFA family protein [Sphingomonadaceae bacterium]